MPRSAPEELALRWVPGGGPVTLKPLAAGLVNDSYRVERDGRVYSMRLAADALELGVDHEWECRVLQCAARAGFAPVVACCEPSQGILVAEWTGGHPDHQETGRGHAAGDAQETERGEPRSRLSEAPYECGDNREHAHRDQQERPDRLGVRAGSQTVDHRDRPAGVGEEVHETP